MPLYDAGREGILDESIRLASGEVRAMLVLEGYAFNPAHRVLRDLGEVENGRSDPLAEKTFAGGVFDAADVRLQARETKRCTGLVYFQPAPTDAEGRLICFFDTVGGMPFTPAAGQVVEIEHANGPDRIFRI